MLSKIFVSAVQRKHAEFVKTVPQNCTMPEQNLPVQGEFTAKALLPE